MVLHMRWICLFVSFFSDFFVVVACVGYDTFLLVFLSYMFVFVCLIVCLGVCPNTPLQLHVLDGTRAASFYGNQTSKSSALKQTNFPQISVFTTFTVA